MDSKILHLLFILLLKEAFALNSCEKQSTCHECIRDESVCVWCGSNDYKGTQCKSASIDQSWCPDALENPKNTNKTIEERPFNSSSGSVTQIKPQRYQLKLRPGQPLTFPFSFKRAQDYPVDLYFLFDASKSMINFKKHTANQSEKIYTTMKSMTKDVMLGMGTFIDKNTLPYAWNITDNSAYSFRHRLNLTNDYKMFKEVTDAAPIGYNRDLPEGSLDALAQVMACDNITGWRKESRKIVVLLTDGPYHAAGDGRSAGIFQPYDGKCYTENGIYKKELEMDYPSVSMIDKLAREKEIIIIFAVTREILNVYRSLSSVITGSKIADLSNTQKDGIVTTLKDIYEKITGNIILKSNIRKGHKKNYELSFEPDCTNPHPECTVGIGTEHNFTGTIKLLEYDGNDHAALDIAIEGINEKLTLDIDVLKDCECERNVEKNSSYCNGETRECGNCKCSELRYGDTCACLRNAADNNANETPCISANMTVPCNGKGLCSCGACSCRIGFGGRYCECDLENCPRNDKGALCSGKAHGECQCDSLCKCKPGWSGPACECFNSEEQCTRNEKVCNNRGSCNCGKCICNGIEVWDSRKDQDKYCVIKPCPECHNLQCKILKDCALCYINQNCKCAYTEYEIFEELPVDLMNSTDWNICPDVRVDVGCYTNFTYKYDDDNHKIILKLQKKKDCAGSYYIFGGIFLLTLLLVGILTLVAWKLITDARDRQEYLAFVKDHEEDLSRPCENPLYEPATTLYNNPAFRKRPAVN